MDSSDHQPRAGGIAAALEAVGRAAQPAIGWSLFTMTAFDPAKLEVERVYSSNPGAYPVGGRKRKRDTEFSRRILLGGEILVCEGDAQIEAIFDDHPTIRSLGLHSSINVPVLLEGRCLGVVNFLMTGDVVQPRQLEAARGVAAEAAVIAALTECESTPLHWPRSAP